MKTTAEKQRDYRARQRGQGKTPITLWLPEATHRAVKAQCAKRGLTIVELICDLVEDNRNET